MSYDHRISIAEEHLRSNEHDRNTHLLKFIASLCKIDLIRYAGTESYYYMILWVNHRLYTQIHRLSVNL